MSSKRWQKIEEIFEQVVELPASEREGVLANLCNGDDDLRREVELLIAADSEAEGFIEEPLLGSNTLASFLNEDFGQDIENSVPPHFIGRRIGAYRLIRELGRGGMGAVFLAQRADDEFKKSVAIKLIKRGMDTDFILKRFRNERQILATLDHPYIARLLDGGTTDDNLPYFVMEYIEGEPIHHYCDANRLTLRERLQLFQNVCSAVNYAHQNLIIHRDLKPGNILVTKDNVPKLLDFGIAKILNPALAADTLAPTLTGMRLMTPEYASPEQIRGESLTPSSDIYSLGVLLYEILTGKRPYRFSSRAPHEIARVICEEEPENPATVLTNGDTPIAAKKENKDEKTIDLVSRNRRATPETLQRELSGNLQNILLKALRKSPSNRYASADDFARDIQAYLDGMPVSAPSVSTTDERFDDSHSPQESLAVLPFRTFHWKAASNGDIDTGDFLSVGLADALISRLSNLKTISVRPTSSVVKFVSDTIEPEAAGRELNVSHVLDGRIQHIGNRVRVTAQLIRTRNNETVWAGQFDEESDDILSLQDSISSQVAHALSLQLTGEEREKIQKRGTNNAKAYECYLRGRFYWHTFEVEGLAKALVCFYEAIAQDPNFALAYTGVADYYNFISVFGLMPPGESFPAAKEAAQKAIELDNTLAEAYTSLGITAFGYDWDFKESERLFKRALELNPNYGEAHLWYAHLLSQQGKNEQALKEMRRAEKLNTISPSLLVNYAFCLRNARKFQEAFDKIRQALTIQPNHYIALQGYTWIVKHLDVADEALKALEKAIERSDRLALPLYGYGYVLATIGRNDEAREIVKELEEIKQKRYIPAIYMVLIYTELGEQDLAFKWLEQCFVERDFWTIWLPVDPRLEALRSDPRFNLYVRRIRPVDDEEIHQSHIPTKILPAVEKGEFAMKPEEKALAAGAQSRPNPNFRRNAALAISALGLLLVVFLAGLKFGWHFGFGNQGNNGTYLHGAHHESEENKLNPGRKVVAVLPFAADESLKEEEELSVGLAQVLTRELGKVTQISVLPTFVREAIGNKTAAETLEMGQQVGATHILRGTLHKTANAVEVFAELVNVADGRVVWSEKFNEPIVELPRLQNSISSHVLSALTIELSAAEKQGINKKYTENSEAYQFYLVGRYQLSKRSQENLNKAIQSFTTAQEKDPNFALAYVGLADAYALLYLYQTPPPKDAHQKARENAEKALALDNTLGEAYASLGLIEFYGERNIAQAENFYRKAVELNPSYENAHHWLALALAAQGKEEALTEIKAAKQLVPNSPAIITAAGIVHFYLRQLELAERDAQKALRIDEGTVSALGLLRWVAILQGKYDDALAYQQKEKLFGGGEETVTSQLNLAQVQAARGDRDAAIGSLNKVFADANYQKMPEYQAYEVALVYIFLDQKDKAFEFLKEAKKTYRANFIASDPRLDKIRNDSRFEALVSSSD